MNNLRLVIPALLLSSCAVFSCVASAQTPSAPHAYRDVTATRFAAHTQDAALRIDKDGDLNMVLASQEPPNRLLLNDGKGRFTNVTAQVISTQIRGRSWNMAQGDVNGDGIPDLCIGSRRDQPRLLLGQ